MREKLIELLAEHCAFKEKRCVGCDEGKYYRPECKTNLFGKIADHLIANGVTVQEWKPISEPPKEKGTYLVCTDNGGVLLGHWYGTAWNAGGGAKKTSCILDGKAPTAERRMIMADRKRCCCNCERNIRHEVEPHGIECYCEIDGHRIGYIECFEGWCRRWKKDHTFDGMKEPAE